MLSPQEEQIIIALRQISQAIDLHSRSLLAKVGLTAPQIAVLRLISACDDWTPGELSEELHLSPQTVAGILNRLEERAFVKRVRSEQDRRSVRVRITSAGRVAVEAAPSLLRDKFRANLAQLKDWERTQILANLQRVASMMNVDSLVVEPFLDNGAPVPQTPVAAPP
jgi:DNA-binding MarR family transcriptional regulator